MQINTRHIRQREQNIFGLISKSKVRLATQEKARKKTMGKSSQKIIDIIENKKIKITKRVIAVQMNILKRNVNPIQSSTKLTLKSVKL